MFRHSNIKINIEKCGDLDNHLSKKKNYKKIIKKNFSVKIKINVDLKP